MTHKDSCWQLKQKLTASTECDFRSQLSEEISNLSNEVDEIKSLGVLIGMALEQIDSDACIDSSMHRIKMLLECYQSRLGCCIDELAACILCLKGI